MSISALDPWCRPKHGKQDSLKAAIEFPVTGLLDETGYPLQPIEWGSAGSDPL